MREEALQVPPNLTIVGIGGCGKGLVFEICEHDWFLKHYLSSERNLKIHIMDTDETEVGQDKKRIAALNEKVEKMGGGRGTASLYHLPHLASISYVSDLTSEDVINRIKGREQSVITWWLHDPEKGIDFNNIKKLDPMIHADFGGGVSRRRGISKAIFYKVKSEAESINFPTFAERGSIAIIVGLGGGTGSGMFIDLARYIRSLRGEEAEIWLFGIIPTTSEGEKEKLNAAVTLTELEYLSLKNPLFNQVVLTSLGPTGYTRGAEGKKEVLEFDSVFPYIFVDWFYLARKDVGIIDATKPYSSFISAVAHVIEYPVEELEELKGNFVKVTDELEEATERREGLNKAVGELLGGQEKHGIPTMEDFEFIKKEIRNMKKVWESEIGRVLKYETVKAIEFYIKNNMPPELQSFEKIEKYEDIIEYMSKLKGFTITEQDLKDECDKKLYRLIPESLEAIKDTAGLFKLISGIENEKVRKVSKEILKGNENITSLMGELRGEIKGYGTKGDKVENELKEKEKVLEEVENLKIEVEKSVKDKMEEITQYVDSLNGKRKKIRDIKEKEEGLKWKIEEILNKCRGSEVKKDLNEESWLRSTGVAEVQREIDSLSQRIGVNWDGLKSLIADIALYYYYDRKSKLSMKFSEKSIGWLKGRPPEKRTKKRDKTRRNEKEDLVKKNADYWNISIGSLFELSVADDFLTKRLRGDMEEIKNDLKKSLGDFELGEEELDELEGALEQQDKGEVRKRIREMLFTFSLSRKGYENRKKKIEEEIRSKKEVKEEIEKITEIMKEVEQLSNETFKLRSELNAHYSLFEEAFIEISRKSTTGNRTVASLYRTGFGDINPNVLSVIKEGSEMGTLDKDDDGRKELDKLISEIKRTYPGLFDNHKLGIHSRQISLSETERWNFRKAGLVISSPSAYINNKIITGEDFEEITDNIKETLALKKRDDARLVSHGYAKPWEIALVLFGATNFLDNISPLVDGGGHWEIYKKAKDNILHHALFLNEGKYIVREKLLKPEEAGEKVNREVKGIKEENEVKEEILSLYEKKDITEVIGR